MHRTETSVDTEVGTDLKGYNEFCLKNIVHITGPLYIMGRYNSSEHSTISVGSSEKSVTQSTLRYLEKDKNWIDTNVNYLYRGKAVRLHTHQQHQFVALNEAKELRNFSFHLKQVAREYLDRFGKMPEGYVVCPTGHSYEDAWECDFCFCDGIVENENIAIGSMYWKYRGLTDGTEDRYNVYRGKAADNETELLDLDKPVMAYISPNSVPGLGSSGILVEVYKDPRKGFIEALVEQRSSSNKHSLLFLFQLEKELEIPGSVLAYKESMRAARRKYQEEADLHIEQTKVSYGEERDRFLKSLFG